jgi:hypothetical protein
MTRKKYNATHHQQPTTNNQQITQPPKQTLGNIRAEDPPATPETATAISVHRDMEFNSADRAILHDPINTSPLEIVAQPYTQQPPDLIFFPSDDIQSYGIEIMLSSLGTGYFRSV